MLTPETASSIVVSLILITGSFRTSKIMNKSGHKYEIHWTEKGGLLYENRDVREYEIRGIPSTFLLDKKGRIIGKDLRGDALDRKLREIFE